MNMKVHSWAEPHVGDCASRDRSRLAYLHVAVPAEMADAVGRHHAALSRFAENLAAAGIARDVAAHSIAEIVDSYRTELAACVVTYRERFHGR